MLNYIWAGMILFGFAAAFFNGRIDQTTKAALESAAEAVNLSIGLMGVLCLWTGIMEIASRAGLVKGIARIIRPVMGFLFPEVPRDHPALGAMVMNIVANMLGLGNAATPLGLKAMTELQRINPSRNTATDAMCMFAVLNTASIQLIPATIIALLTAAGSLNPTQIIAPVWITTICAAFCGIMAARFFARRKGRTKRWPS